MTAIFLACAILGGTLRALFPRLPLGRARRLSVANSASSKARTVFIARRAVTAGYRRIAA
jgi:hypothetical protein